MNLIVLILRILLFVLGLTLVAVTLYSAIKTFVLPRSAPDTLTRLVFVTMRRIFNLRLRRVGAYPDRDRIMALFAPFSLLALLPVWYFLVLLAYTAMFWSLGGLSLYQAFRVSVSSLLTLGFAIVEGLPHTLLEFSEATLGLILVALLIAYLPTMYSAFSRRETAVTLLEVRAGSPPSAEEMLARFHRIHGLDGLSQQWRTWETWFADVEESHTSLPALVFFRSPQPDHSWVTAAGAILDAAALTQSTLEIPSDPAAALCLRAGYLCLRRVADFFSIPHPPDPHFPNEPISVARAEYDAVCDRLAAQGIPMKSDREKAWCDFAGWRVNYDRVLLALAGLTLAPSAPWSGDRAATGPLPPIKFHFPGGNHNRANR